MEDDLDKALDGVAQMGKPSMLMSDDQWAQIQGACAGRSEEAVGAGIEVAGGGTAVELRQFHQGVNQRVRRHVGQLVDRHRRDRCRGDHADVLNPGARDLHFLDLIRVGSLCLHGGGERRAHVRGNHFLVH